MRDPAPTHDHDDLDPGAWRQHAACQGHDPRWWVPDPDQRRDHWEARIVTRAALTICRACPVRGECLAFALDTADSNGIYGGKTPDQRRAAAHR